MSEHLLLVDCLPRLNRTGLYDLAGNVDEWCNDWHSASYYGSSPPNDPKGPTSGSARVHRGGSWSYSAVDCRTASRDSGYPGSGSSTVGFRCVRSVGQ
jgi:formylglycine-generating enzyme required for sulfatase activity